MDRATRLVLVNQFEVLKALYPEREAELARKQSILASGYTSQYSDVFDYVHEDEASAEMQEETMAILDMFRALHHAQRNGWKPSNPDRASFRGFDGNNDDHYHFAEYLLNERGLFSESAPNKNSHSMATIEIYRRMLPKWKATANKIDLSIEDAEAIIAP